MTQSDSSRGACVLEEDFPRDPRDRDEALLKLFTSPNAAMTVSSAAAGQWVDVVALVGGSQGDGTENSPLTVRFGRLRPDEGGIDYSMVLADFAPAVARFAVDQKLARRNGRSALFLRDASSGCVFRIELPRPRTAMGVSPATPGSTGDAVFSGRVTFTNIGTGKRRLLPTGNPREGVATTYGEYIVSVVDAAVPIVFVGAEQLDMEGTESPGDLNCDEDFLRNVAAIRASVVEVLGVGAGPSAAANALRATPRVVTVFPSADYNDLSGRYVSVMDTDLVCREVALGQVRQDISVDAAISTAVAAHTKGTVVQDSLLNDVVSRTVRIGHPSGVTVVDVAMEERGGQRRVASATTEASVTPLLDGYVYLP